jgi:hypothetical protein
MRQAKGSRVTELLQVESMLPFTIQAIAMERNFPYKNANICYHLFGGRKCCGEIF